MTRFHLSPAVAEKGVIGAYSLLTDFSPAPSDAAGLAAFVDQAVAGARESLGRQAIADDPVLAGYRELHKAFGVPTRKLHAAPEALFRSVERHGDIPRIAPLVDLYNAVSLETRLAHGLHDLRRIEGDVWLRLTTGAERYHPIGASAPEPVRPGEYAYVDAAADVICRLEVRQVEKTKVTASTAGVFVIVQGNRQTPPEAVKAGHDRLVTLLQRFFGGTSAILHAP